MRVLRYGYHYSLRILHSRVGSPEPLIFMLLQLILYVPDLKQYLNEKHWAQSADYDRKQYLSLQEVSDKIKIMILLHNSEITSFIIDKKNVFVFPCEWWIITLLLQELCMN